MNRRERQERATYAREQKRVALGMVIIAIICMAVILLTGEPYVQ